ncbi:MAG: desulfoferrodoxin family protein [Lentihominibacter sp.]|jgi:superoxide reductase
MLFYKCDICGNFITFLGDKYVTPVCCGEEMKEVVANTEDAAQEKHVPVVTRDGNSVEVNVGSVDHPMIPEHYITFIILETNRGYQKADLKPGQAPKAVFALADGEEPVAAYEYCNLHGLWKAAI